MAMVAKELAAFALAVTAALLLINAAAECAAHESEAGLLGAWGCGVLLLILLLVGMAALDGERRRA